MLINEKFGMEYSMKDVRELLRQLGMKSGKTYSHDHGGSNNAEIDLKKPTLHEDDIKGLMDVDSPQTTSKREKMCSLARLT